MSIGSADEQPTAGDRRQARRPPAAIAAAPSLPRPTAAALRLRSLERLSAALLLATTVITLLLALRAAPLGLLLPIEAPLSDQYLSDFRVLERNEATAYRWSRTRGALMLNGLSRAPLIVDLRMTSPRPADEPLADMRLARGRWQTPPFAVRGDWRRYQILVPARGDQPELSLAATPFRPDKDDRDRRSLGVALSRIRFSIPSTLAPLTAGYLLLGPWRTGLLLALPLLTSALGLRLLGERAWSPAAAAVPALASLAILWSQASDPLASAILIKEAWLPAIAIGSTGLAWAALRPWAAAPERAALRALTSDRLRPWAVAAAALCLGTVMVVVMPPWEHPDEASHFEFAWLIANHPAWPAPGTSDPRIAWIQGGGRALYHQPLYHLLVSVPLRLAGGLSIVGQLYLARSLSLLACIATALLAERLARELLPPGHTLRWLAPLALALNPTFANLMTSVNNDVAVTLICTWALWGAARTLARGLSWRRLAWLLSAIPLAMLSKNTGTILAGIVPLVLVVALWAQRGWRWRWLLTGAGTAASVALLLILAWGDPAHWYRWGHATSGPVVRAERPEAPLGPHVLRMDGVAVPDYEGISAPTDLDVSLANRKVTAGAWVWASRPATIWGPGVVFKERELPLAAGINAVAVDTTPRFIAWTYSLPARLEFAQFMAWSVAPGDDQPLEIYYDGAVLALGAYPTETPPQFEGPGAHGGVWGDRPFTNLIRNGDAEQGWLALRPEADRLIARYARRSPSRLVASLADIDVTLRLELRDYLPWMVFTSFGAYGGRIFLRDPIWQYLLPGLASVILAGMLLGARRLRRLERRRRIALVTLALLSLEVWAMIIAAHLPVNFLGGIPSPRYGFTVMAPTMLLVAGGWLALWPPARRGLAAAILIAGLLLLDTAAVSTIAQFENTSCALDPVSCAFRPIPWPLEFLGL